MMDDARLVYCAAQGDAGAFELLVRRHSEALWRHARLMLRDGFAAEEAVQDTFVKAYRGLACYRAEAAVRTWLLQICHRTCIDRCRRKGDNLVPSGSLREEPVPESPPELPLLLEQALDDLPDEERDAFKLVHVLGYSRREAAEVANVPASTMRSRVARACRQLAIAMGPPTRRNRA